MNLTAAIKITTDSARQAGLVGTDAEIVTYARTWLRATDFDGSDPKIRGAAFGVMTATEEELEVALA